MARNRATGNLVDSGAIVQTGMGTLSLAADTKADGTGDDGLGRLGAGATVVSTNSRASAITLREVGCNQVKLPSTTGSSAAADLR